MMYAVSAARGVDASLLTFMDIGLARQYAKCSIADGADSADIYSLHSAIDHPTARAHFKIGDGHMVESRGRLVTITL